LVPFCGKKELVLAAQEAGKVEGKGRKTERKSLYNGMLKLVQHDKTGKGENNMLKAY